MELLLDKVMIMWYTTYKKGLFMNETDDILNEDEYEEFENATDKEVDEMLETWDKVRCEYCGKEISMLNAKIIRNHKGYESFVCRSH